MGGRPGVAGEAGRTQRHRGGMFGWRYKRDALLGSMRGATTNIGDLFVSPDIIDEIWARAKSTAVILPSERSNMVPLVRPGQQPPRGRADQARRRDLVPWRRNTGLAWLRPQ